MIFQLYWRITFISEEEKSLQSFSLASVSVQSSVVVSEVSPMLSEEEN